MHDNEYDVFDSLQIENRIEKRIKWAVMNGVNTCIITGTGEALQNISFLKKLSEIFNKMGNPFPNIELQTTGVMLEKYLPGTITEYPNIDLFKELGVNTISLSVSNMFDDKLNNEIIGIPEKLNIELVHLCDFLRVLGFNIRLSLNMLKDYNDYSPEQILKQCNYHGAHQVTFRKMFYEVDKDGFASSTEAKWTKANKCSDEVLTNIEKYIINNGKLLYDLPFGASVYSINNMSVVIDNDCMSKNNDKSLKYVILRENGRLYARWDDEGSLIF
jgi:hypothetical protein